MAHDDALPGSAELDFDVAVIGGSLAGSALALELGAHGIRVAVIDRQEFPRRKPCGEGLSPIGVQLLNRLGLEAVLGTLPSHRFSGFQIWRHADCTPVCFPLSGDSGASGLGIERTLLDTALQRTAASMDSVTALLRCEVFGIQQQSDRTVLSTDKGEITTRYVVAACGARAPILTLLGLAPLPRSQRAGWALHLEGAFLGVLSDVHIMLRDEGEVYCTPVGPQRMNLALLSARRPLPPPRAPVLSEILSAVACRTGFIGEPLDTPRGTVGLSSFRRPAACGRVLLIGDSCEQFDPLGGMGMSHALLSAAFAARALMRTLRGEMTIEAAAREYANERERAARPLRSFTNLATFALRRVSRTRLWPLLRSKGARRFTAHTLPPLQIEPLPSNLTAAICRKNSLVSFERLHR